MLSMHEMCVVILCRRALVVDSSVLDQGCGVRSKEGGVPYLSGFWTSAWKIVFLSYYTRRFNVSGFSHWQASQFINNLPEKVGPPRMLCSEVLPLPVLTLPWANIYKHPVLFPSGMSCGWLLRIGSCTVLLWNVINSLSSVPESVASSISEECSGSVWISP